jgi:hypothetical protein
MNKDVATNYAELEKKYRELADALHMIRRAVDRAVRAGILPSVDHRPRRRITPLQECEAIARAIYAAAGKPKSASGVEQLAGLDRDRPTG